MQEKTIPPYELPDVKNHSFFFVDARINPDIEAKLHRHDAWELYYVIQGCGQRMTGDTLQPFSAGDVALIPPSMLHRWEFAPDSTDKDGHIRYLMVAFSHTFVERCMETFPEMRNSLDGIEFPVNALNFGPESSRIIRQMLIQMNGTNELGRLCEMLRLLSVVFTSSDTTFAGRPIRIEHDVRRMQHICTYVMRHYTHTISLNDIAAEVCMNRSAFCSFFKRCKGITFLAYLTAYRIDTACEMLKTTPLSIAEICYAVGFNDIPHFNRLFKKAKQLSPRAYRARFSEPAFNKLRG